jgi:hypothetical protein
MNKFRIVPCDVNPNLIQPCELERRQKVKGRWRTEACATRGTTILAIVRDGQPTIELTVCRECLGRIAKDFVSLLSYAD